MTWIISVLVVASLIKLFQCSLEAALEAKEIEIGMFLSP